MAFTRYMPHLVQSLTLIAPSGLMRSSQIGWRSFFLYSQGFLPERFLQYLVRQRLQPAMRNRSQKVGGTDGVDNHSKAEVRNVQAKENSGNSDASGGSSYDNAKLSQLHPHITTAWIVSWQLQHHPGFISAFISSIRNGPIYNQDADWSVVGSRLAEQKHHLTDPVRKHRGLHRNKVLMIFGESDPVIIKDQTIRDATIVLGKDHIEVVILDGGHEVPITRAPETAKTIWDFWLGER